MVAIVTSPKPSRSQIERVGQEVFVPQHYHSAHSSHPPTPLSAGTAAPDFSLPATPDQSISLSDFHGRPVIVAFYPADWSPVCSDQMALYNQLLPEFRRYNAQLLGISVDGSWCHAAFAKDRNLHFPLLADFEPKGAVSVLYGAYQRRVGESARALFVIDGDGIIRWSYLSPVGVNPGADGILEALELLHDEQAGAAMQKGTTP
jgi:peroxiredoxin